HRAAVGDCCRSGTEELRLAMIRINLLGQTRPRAARRPTMAVDTGGAMPVAFIGVGVLVGVLVLGFFYYTWDKQLTEENNKIKTLQAQKTELEQTDRKSTRLNSSH